MGWFNNKENNQGFIKVKEIVEEEQVDIDYYQNKIFAVIDMEGDNEDVFAAIHKLLKEGYVINELTKEIDKHFESSMVFVRGDVI